ncbi:MAG: hypothetical protein ABFD81_06785 [Syntrophaceae bacterium]
MHTIDNLTQIQGTIGRIGGDFLRSYIRPVARFVAAIARNLVSVWSGHGTIKEKLFAPLAWVLDKAAAAPTAPNPAAPTTLPADIARLITLLCARVNEAHSQGVPEENPHRGEKVRAFIENLDFGELMVMLRGCDPYALNAIETFNREIWKYPAKVVSLVASLIAVVNTALGSVSRLIRPLTTGLGPDLTTDILLSVLKTVKADEVGRLVNTASEILRRFQTGSLLLARAGKPLLRIELTAAMKTAFAQLDPDVIAKTRVALAELSEALGAASTDVLDEHPELLQAWVANYAAASNPRLRARVKKARSLSALAPTVFEQALADLDVQTAADIVNIIVRTLTDLHSQRPALLTNLARAWGDAIDADALREAAEGLLPECVEALRPAAEALLPSLIDALASLLSGADEATLERFRAVLAGSQGGAR